MPECDDLTSLYKRLKDIILAKGSSLSSLFKGAFQDVLSDLENLAGDVASDALDITLAGITNSIFDNFMNQPLGSGISSIGTMIAAFLSSGQTAKLGLAAMLMYLLKVELERRSALSQFLLFDLQAINQLLLLVLNSPAFKGKTNTLSNLTASHKHVLNAETFLGEAYSQLNNFNYFSPVKITTADTELTLARKVLSTPIADAIEKIIQDAHLLRGRYRDPGDRKIITWEDVYEYTTEPESIVDDIKLIFKDVDFSDSSKFEDNLDIIDKNTKEFLVTVENRWPSRATYDQQLDTLIGGIAEFANIDFSGESLTQIQSVIIEFAEHFSTYVPYDPTRMAATLVNIYKAGAGLKDRFDQSGKNAQDFVFSSSAFRQTAEELKSTMAERSLLSLNNSIQTKIRLLSKYPENWSEMSELTSMMLPMTFYAYDMTKNVRTDMATYIEDTPNTQMMLSLKIKIWKKKIENIQRYLDGLKDPSKQLADVGIAQDRLETLVNQLKVLAAQYVDDNTGTPESELAFDLLNNILTKIWDVIFHPSKLRELQSLVAESILSLKNSIKADSSLIGSIVGFSGSVLTIEGVADSIKLAENVLDLEKFEGTPVYSLIKEVRNGNIELLMNAAMTFLTDFTTGALQALGKIQNFSTNKILDITLQSIGSIFANIKSCAELFLDGGKASLKAFEEQNKAAQELAEIDGEKSKMELFELGIMSEETHNQINLVSGTAKELDFIQQDDIEEEGLNAVRFYTDGGHTTNSTLMRSIEALP